MIHDLDGSVGGIPDSYILIHDGENDSVATDETCEIHSTWNAAVCTGDVGRLFFNEPDSGFAGLGAGSPVTVLRNGKDHRIIASVGTPTGIVPAAFIYQQSSAKASAARSHFFQKLVVDLQIEIAR